MTTDRGSLIQQAAVALLALQRGTPHNLTKKDIDSLGQHLIAVDLFLERQSNALNSDTDEITRTALTACRYGEANLPGTSMTISVREIGEIGERKTESQK